MPNFSRRFDAPAAAARAFATDVLGFTELVLGGAIPTGEGTAMVPVQQREGGPDTVISLQQMEDGAWYALGASTEDITIDGRGSTAPRGPDRCGSPGDLGQMTHMDQIGMVRQDPLPASSREGEGHVGLGSASRRMAARSG